ncbi:MAG: TolC family protein [Qingshengfaniella sp.]
MTITPRLAPLVLLVLAGCVQPPSMTGLETAILAETTPPARAKPALGETAFGQAITRAVSRSPSLDRSEASLREAEAGLLAEGGGYLPRLSLGMSVPVTGGAHLYPFISLTQMLYDAGASRSRQAAARARALGSLAGRQDVGNAAALTAIETWGEVVLARGLMAVTGQTMSELEKTAALIEDRANAGAGSSTEALTARSRLANLRADWIAAQARVRRAETGFAVLFGDAPPARIALPPRAPAAPVAALADSPLMLVAEAELLAAQADLSAAQAARVPSLSAVGSAVRRTDGVTAGLESEYQLAPGNRRAASVAAAQARVAGREASREATRRDIDNRLAVLRTERIAARDQLTAAQEAQSVTAENLAAMREQFEIGGRSMLDLLDAQRESLEAELRLVSARHAVALLDYARLAATGDLLDAFGIVLPSPNALLPKERSNS